MTETPFTTSDVVAIYAKISHHAIQQMIAKHETDFKEFGKVAFEMRASEGSKTNQSEKVYRLNEEQATLLLTYLKNTEPVRKFKKNLVKEFYLMRKELTRRQVLTASRRPIRKDLTDNIRDCLPESEHKAMYYMHFTNLAYKLAFGMTASQLRKFRGANKKANASEYMTAEEIVSVTKYESWISVLLEMGYSYEDIKAQLSSRAQIGATH